MKRKQAFTLIELLIVIVIIAILSAAFLVRFQSATVKATFDDQIVSTVRVLEQVKGYSLTNYLVNDTTPVDYYMVSFYENYVQLDAVATDGTSETMERVDYNAGYITDATAGVFIYYIPPYGEICFAQDCSDTDVAVTVTFSESSGNYSKSITVSRYGGYPDISDYL